MSSTLDRFEGFVPGGAAVTLPAQLFAEVLPAIEDEAELRVTLYALYAIGRQRGALRAVRASELAREGPLRRLLASCADGSSGVDVLARALDAVVARGTLLACALADGDALYLVNNEAGRRALPRIASGALAVPGAVVTPRSTAMGAGGVARVYEQEIGALTESIAEALARAEERWPAEWIVEALRLAAANNARSWRYAQAILERWETEGKDDGTTGSAAAGTGGGTAGRDHGPFEQVIRRS